MIFSLNLVLILKKEMNMKIKKISLFLLLTASLFLAVVIYAQAIQTDENPTAKPGKLMVLWTSGDRDVALKMVFMYTFNAKKKGWWEHIRLVIWGPSSLLLSEDKELQQEVKKIKEAGVELLA